LFQEIFDAEFKQKFAALGLTYEHRLIDDMVASAMKWSGGYVWAARITTATCNRTRSRKLRSLGLMTSVLMTPTAGPSRPRRRMAR